MRLKAHHFDSDSHNDEFQSHIHDSHIMNMSLIVTFKVTIIKLTFLIISFKTIAVTQKITTFKDSETY